MRYRNTKEEDIAWFRTYEKAEKRCKEMQQSYPASRFWVARTPGWQLGLYPWCVMLALKEKVK